MAKSRSYGWVQNPASFSTLKKVVQIFDNQSAHYASLRSDLICRLIPFEDLKQELLKKLSSNATLFSYLELVGTSKNKMGKPAKTRSEAVADGLIQVSIRPQNYNTTGKEWTDNWTSDGYLRWALSLNFVSHDRDTDLCEITSLGLKFSRCVNESEAELEILREALLRYPPATQVLKILNESSKPITKYQIGDQLGFKGEKGFTSYPDSIMKSGLRTATKQEQRKIRSDIEGTSDKYARMICGWLQKVGYVEKAPTRMIQTESGEISGFPEYVITLKGKHAYNQSIGSSKNKCREKFITWEFLSVVGKNRDYIRTRRAYILKALEKTTSFNVLCETLSKKGFKDCPEVIKNDICGLNSIGIRIDFSGNRVVLRDRIANFSIPALDVTAELKDAALEQRKADLLAKTNLPPKFYELVDIAYDGKRNRDFEMVTLDLFTTVYGFQGKLLGGGSKPDGVIFTNDYGVIIDTKAYGDGYSKSIHQEDEMVRYIEDNQERSVERNKTKWWNAFTEESIGTFYFLWVSSFFTGQFSDQLISTARRTKTNGGCIGVEQLLIGADLVQKKTISLCDFEAKLTNEEIMWTATKTHLR